MTEENVETVRRIYAEWAQGRMSAGVELFDPEIRFESFMPDANERIVANGPEEVGTFMRDFLSDWRDYSLVGDDFEEMEEGLVLVKGHQKGTGRQSGVEVEDTMCSAWAFRGDRVAHLVFERDPETALAAVRSRPGG